MLRQFTGRTVREWWFATAAPVRKVTYICLPMGLLLLGAGIYGDGQGWWDDRGFLTNVVSSFTSLLFGVPLALLAIAHLSTAQAEAVERRAAQRRATAALEEFVRALMGGFNADTPAAVAACLARLRGANGRFTDEVRHGSQMLTQSAFTERDRCVDEVLRFRGAERRWAWGTEIAQRWQQLDREIRPRVQDAGLRWIRLDASAEIGEAVATMSRLDPYPFGRQLAEDVLAIGTGDATARAARSERLMADALAGQTWINSMRKIVMHLVEVQRIAL
ncbi:hypothetical protein ACWD7C_38310 [Streptomyces sp. NPDC005134]